VLDIALLRRPTYRISLVVSTLVTISMMANLVMQAQFLRQAWGYGPLRAGLAVTPLPVLAGVTAPFAGRLAGRYGHRTIILVGVAMSASGCSGTACFSMRRPTITEPCRAGPRGHRPGRDQHDQRRGHRHEHRELRRRHAVPDRPPDRRHPRRRHLGSSARPERVADTFSWLWLWFSRPGFALAIRPPAARKGGACRCPPHRCHQHTGT
jgi:MFS family permease